MAKQIVIHPVFFLNTHFLNKHSICLAKDHSTWLVIHVLSFENVSVLFFFCLFQVGCAASGCSSSTSELGKQTDSEENRWLHYNEFVFYRS